ncbi:unnamed protein product [Heterobilharzia americana]|nr:unnamed protein product [Heterobilharzia americana]CAH8619183.1 unnamed protein product [Heterobilharzia americana]
MWLFNSVSDWLMNNLISVCVYMSALKTLGFRLNCSLAMRRVVIQCRNDEDIPVLLEIINSYGAVLIRPASPERFDMVHVDISEESDTTLADFKAELETKISNVSVRIF